MVENVCCYATPNDKLITWIQKLVPLGKIMKHGIIDRASHRYWDGIEEMKVKHFVNHSGLKYRNMPI